MVSWEIVTAVELVLLSTTLWFAPDPTVTLPKFTDEEFAEREPTFVALFDAVPAPTEPQPDIQMARQTVAAAEQQTLQNARDAKLEVPGFWDCLDSQSVTLNVRMDHLLLIRPQMGLAEV